MTLPFRRRHHDGESGHDRARRLISDGLLASLSEDEAGWLARHLDGCAECRADEARYREDQALLRGLRAQAPEPPRDLWARTSAAIDREARRHAPVPAAAGTGVARGGGWRAFPLGAAASLVVLAVTIGALLLPGRGPSTTPPPGASDVAVAPPTAPTGIAVQESEPLVVFRETANGSWELVYADVREVCPRNRPGCAPKPNEQAQAVELRNRPSEITMSPTNPEIAIASTPEDGDTGQILVVPVREPGATPAVTIAPTEPPATPTTAPESTAPASPATESPDTSESPGPPTPSPIPTPPGIAIATGVRLVGDLAYSPDGRWIAFSAEPSDGSTGPDLFLWMVGQPVATAVTSDHRTYFASWHDGRILASRVELAGEPGAPVGSPAPDASDTPSASGDGEGQNSDGGNGNGNGGGGNGNGNGNGRPEATTATATASPTSSSGPDASAGPSASPAAPIEGRPVSFLIDPATLEVTDLARPDVWLPVLDRSGTSVVYWSGSLTSTDGMTWALGTGELVLDRWSDEVPLPLPTPDGSVEPGAPPTVEPDAPASVDPAASLEPSTAPGPVDEQTVLVPGPKAAFEASFSRLGGHLAIWVGEDLADDIGRLHLLVLDPETGAVRDGAPLEGAPALRRFSIGTGRLAWVTPPGQDGHDSVVQVLGWKGDDFGEIETQSGSDLYVVP